MSMISDALLWVYPLYVCGRAILKINIRELMFKPPYHLCFMFNPSLLYKDGIPKVNISRGIFMWLFILLIVAERS